MSAKNFMTVKTKLHNAGFGLRYVDEGVYLIRDYKSSETKTVGSVKEAEEFIFGGLFTAIEDFLNEQRV